MASTYLHLALALTLSASAVACAATPAGSDTGASDSDITGVTDLSEMESALGLQKDFKNPDGTWYRGDDKLKAGACYKQLIEGPDGASYQFRRYSTGASFFKKQGAGAASGDERPVVCVDVDIDRWDGTQNYHEAVALNDFEIDSVIRYRLGRPEGSDGAAGSSYNTFDGGHVHYVSQFCWPDASGWSFQPLQTSELTKHCLQGMEFPGSQGEIDGDALLTVYQFAYAKSSGNDRFSSAADPIGRYINVVGDWQSPDQVVKYEKADLHILRQGDTTLYRLTPHDDVADHWFYECQLHVTSDGSAPATATCGGN